MTSTTIPSSSTTTHHRLPGPDVVRALAMIGVVVMNFHGYLLLQRDTRGDNVVQRFFDPWTGPLATRFAATFVLVAGVGVTLLTRRAIGDPLAVVQRRLTLVRRGLVLYGGGLLLDEIWTGTILPYYGAMFVLAALLFTLRTRWIVTVGASAAVAGAGLAWWRLERRLAGHSTAWLDSPGRHSPGGLLFGVLVSGTHPLLPWLAFFCAGIVLGRVLGRAGWRAVAIVGGLATFAVATLLDARTGRPSRPAEHRPVHPEPALHGQRARHGGGRFRHRVVAAEVNPVSPTVRWLADAGAMSLTLYVLHALTFDLLVNRLHWIRPTGLDTALLFAAVYWAVGLAAASWWHGRYGIGPLEWLYRKLGG
jgi:uncharacterized protein